MCKQAAACVLLIAGLVFLLLCFVPTWVIGTLGIALLAAGIAWLFLKLKKGR